MRRLMSFGLIAVFIAVVCGASSTLHAQTQQGEIIVLTATNSPLASLAAAAAAERALPVLPGPPIEVANPSLEEEGLPDLPPVNLSRDPALMPFAPVAPATVVTSFDGSDNVDNLAIFGSISTPPDTVGDVSATQYVQMINRVTTIFDKTGTELAGGPFSTAAFWSGGSASLSLCRTDSDGDPIVIYDEAAQRWIVSQFAFATDFLGTPITPFLQCVAVSQTADATGAFNRYAFDFSAIGFNDYPKFGVVTAAITYTANLFSGPSLAFAGTFLGAIDKACTYAGTATCNLVGANIGGSQFGFLPIDLDDPTGTAGVVPALFGTAMGTAFPGSFDIWVVGPDFVTPANTVVFALASVAISTFDPDICPAARERCIPHPGGGDDLEAISDRLMHRFQVRQMSGYLSAVTSHTVDVDTAAPGATGRAGIRWYEFRSTDGGASWTLQQEGTFGPTDTLHRWMPSIAQNAAGDIALGYMVSNATTPVGVRLTGRTTGATAPISAAPGAFDVEETVCRVGVTGADWFGRAGDYSSTNVDPSDDSFWHTNEFGRVATLFGWGTTVCKFTLPGSSATGYYVLDRFGGVHAGGGAPILAPPTPYWGFDVAQDIEMAATGYYVLDRFGGVHAGAGAPILSPATPYWGFDVAQNMELASTGYYTLDRFGGVHAGGGAPILSPPTPYWGFDVGQDIELAATGYYVLDRFGGVHAGAGAPILSPPTPYWGFDVAQDLELAATGYYVLDRFGGVHAGAGAPILSPPTPYWGFNVAQNIELDTTGYYVLDRFGGVHAGAGAPVMSPPTPYWGFNVGQDLELNR